MFSAWQSRSNTHEVPIHNFLSFLEAKKKIPVRQATYWGRPPLCVGERRRRQPSPFYCPTRKNRIRRMMAAAKVNPDRSDEPELHLLLADTFEPLWKSLFRGLSEFFFPKKLPPLKLESKPIPVKDIGGFCNYKKNGALGSTLAHLLVLGLIIGVTFSTMPRPVPARPKPQIDTILIDPGDYLLKPANTQAGGG